MLRADVITLIAENPSPHGILEGATETERTVYCTVSSVGMNETYTALAQGLRPEYRFILHDFEYNAEERLRFHDVEYRVIRAYVNGNDEVELTCERR